MIYEWRVYEIAEGKRAALHERFANHSVRLFEKHGMGIVGFWEGKFGGRGVAICYILSFTDQSHLDRAWRDFREDPEWQLVKAESERNGPLVDKITSTTLTPTDYSPLK